MEWWSRIRGSARKRNSRAKCLIDKCSFAVRRCKPAESSAKSPVFGRKWDQILIQASGLAAAGLGISGQLTPLSGDLAHRVTESGIIRPEGFRHSLARLSVGSALFGRHRHQAESSGFGSRGRTPSKGNVNVSSKRGKAMSSLAL